MLFTIGTKVRMLHTGDTGTVKALLDGGMVSVYIEKYDMEIPAFLEDLVRAEEHSRHPVKAKFVEGKKEPAVPPPAPPVPIETQYTILKSYGLQIAFEPMTGRDGLTEKYGLYLLNDTNYGVVFHIRLLLNARRPEVLTGNLLPVSFQRLGDMLYDDLNEAPELEVECRWNTTEGLTDPVSKSLKIKPKSFFNSLRTAPFLNKPVHLYRLFEKPENAPEKPGEDLQSYTKRMAQPNLQSNTYVHLNDTSELASFEPEVDLHIEKLTDNWRKLSNADILRIQLSHFEKYIHKAIRLGVSRVYIIHGVGQGKLRDAVATSLLRNPDVRTFKNEYHARYGWGATEVLL